ncbi:MAG: acetyl-CoA carboxylase biotin carboxyl carrier protein [Immundisolibacterales bacterium]|nr:acetyl-CoA carboxylase biotin carboxyl carrier protein [Immundisolibacterales bacterium]
MDLRKIKKLIELLDESGIAEIEVTEGEESVRISRYGSAAAVVQAPGPVPFPHPIAAGAPVAPAAGVSPPSPAAAEERPSPKGFEIEAPMVGTMYRSSSPGAPPFVEVGSRISAGDVVCIIEAMKILNQIESDVSGVVSEILVENGQPVEFGQTLIVVE